MSLGTPERPLSDLGKASYVKYWAQTSISALMSSTFDKSEAVSLEQLAQETAVEPGDIAMALEAVGALVFYQVREALYIY